MRVGPGERLESGDICEVLIDQHGEPIDQRLLDLAGTPLAKSRIRRALQKDTTGAARGRKTFHDVLARQLEEQEAPASATTIDQQVATICRARGYHSVDAFYRAVARGEASPDQVIRALIDGLLIPRLLLDAIPAELRAHAGQIRLALCCHPRPSQPAVAVPIHGGRQIKVHRAGCPRIVEPAYPLAWRPAEQQAYAAEVVYESWDRPGLLHQLTGALNAVGGINIRALSADVPEPSLARVRFTFEAPGRQQLEQVQQALEALPERRHVELRTVTLIEEGFRITLPLVNPYGPGPVGRRPFFVGRSAEVQQILAHLEGRGAQHMLIRGPKRIGKSSLLDHLARYHLDQLEDGRAARLTEPCDRCAPLRPAAGPAGRAAGPEGCGARSHAPDRRRRAGRATRSAALAASLARSMAQATPSVWSCCSTSLAWWPAGCAAPARSASSSTSGARCSTMGTCSRGWPLSPRCPTMRWSACLSGLAGAAAQPSLRIGELGIPIRLAVLDEGDARDLIAAPVRAHLDYAPEDMALLLDETGGHPYYIHLVCSHIVAAIQMQRSKTGLRFHERQTVPTELIRSALHSVFSNEDAFHHILADSSPDTGAVLRATAALTGAGERLIGRRQVQAQLARSRPSAGGHAITWAIEERPDLLVEAGDQIGIRVALVARWLERHVA